MIEAFLASPAVVTFGEIRDKTMLLALVLSARLHTPWQILAGIFAATVVNHGLSAFAGREIAGLVDSQWFQIAVALGFIAMAAWTLVPDKFDDDDDAFIHRGGPFLTTLVAFFLVEIGDKTQVATIALGAQYGSVVAVALGTTLGMMIANTPAVFLGKAIVERVSLRATRITAAAIFLVLGLLQLARVLELI